MPNKVERKRQTPGVDKIKELLKKLAKDIYCGFQ